MAFAGVSKMLSRRHELTALSVSHCEACIPRLSAGKPMNNIFYIVGVVVVVIVLLSLLGFA